LIKRKNNMGINHVIEQILGIGWAVACVVALGYSMTLYIIEKNKKL